MTFIKSLKKNIWIISPISLALALLFLTLSPLIPKENMNIRPPFTLNIDKYKSEFKDISFLLSGEGMDDQIGFGASPVDQLELQAIYEEREHYRILNIREALVKLGNVEKTLIAIDRQTKAAKEPPRTKESNLISILALIISALGMIPSWINIIKKQKYLRIVCSCSLQMKAT